MSLNYSISGSIFLQLLYLYSIRISRTFFFFYYERCITGYLFLHLSRFLLCISAFIFVIVLLMSNELKEYHTPYEKEEEKKAQALDSPITEL